MNPPPHNPDKDTWYRVASSDELPTPALLVYADRIEENIRRMIRMAGNVERLRPHVKTHKMSAIVRIKIRYGITRFKCATLAEAEMVAQCGGEDILLAMQPVGPQIGRLLKLQQAYPRSRISALVDCERIFEQLVACSKESGQETDVWLDIDNGMNRTGISPGAAALSLYARMSRTPSVRVRGLHVYDGHIHEAVLAVRKTRCDADYQTVLALIQSINREGFQVPAVVAGGTPTFPLHLHREDTEVSPGTCVLWDSGYAARFTDLDFLPAAVLLARVISKPGDNRLCLDLGHKAMAAEMPPPRISFLNLNVSRFVSQHEEHLVVESPDSDRWHPGDTVYGIPWHICPTVPRYPAAHVVSNGEIAGMWQIDARDRMIHI